MQTGAHSLKLRTWRTCSCVSDRKLYRASSEVQTTYYTYLSMFVRQLHRVGDIVQSRSKEKISHAEHTSRQRDLCVIIRVRIRPAEYHIQLLTATQDLEGGLVDENQRQYSLLASAKEAMSLKYLMIKGQ